MSIEEHAEELASDLGVDKEEVIEDLENLVNYSVPVEEAKASLRRKYGGGGGDGTSGPESKAVADVTTEDDRVTVTVRVLTVGRRSIQYQGDEQVIHEGEVADETGTISYTAWVDPGFSPGDDVTLGNVGVREWEGDPELNVSESTTVTDADEPVATEARVGGDRDLAELRVGDRGRNVIVQVQEVERKVIDGRNGETEILSGVLGDESGRLPFTDWEPHDALAAGTSVRIDDVFVREFRGAPEVNVSAYSTVTELGETVPIAEDAQTMGVGKAVASGGQFDVAVTGTVIDVREGSGLIERCPECGRVAQNGQCRSHGAVDGEDDLRTKAIVDDGTGTLTAVLDDAVTADIYGGGLEEAKEHARDAMDKSVVAERIADRIVGREYRVRGSLSVDDYGATLTAEDFGPVEDDPAQRARAFLDEVEGVDA